jgi:hypothetical protein
MSGLNSTLNYRTFTGHSENNAGLVQLCTASFQKHTTLFKNSRLLNVTQYRLVMSNTYHFKKVQHSTTFVCYVCVISNLKYLIIFVLAIVAVCFEKWRNLRQRS